MKKKIKRLKKIHKLVRRMANSDDYLWERLAVANVLRGLDYWQQRMERENHACKSPREN